MLVVFSAAMMSILSATRGWMIAFGLIIIMSGLLVRTIDFRKIAALVLLSALLTFIGSKSDRIRSQVEFSRDRLLKIESIRSGDLTAKGTLRRLDVRSPRVLKVWKQNPVFGWGFSDVGFKSSDGHVGNQTLLMFSGIVGFVLLNGFLLYFSYQMYIAYRRSEVNAVTKRLSDLYYIHGRLVCHTFNQQPAVSLQYSAPEGNTAGHCSRMSALITTCH